MLRGASVWLVLWAMVLPARAGTPDFVPIPGIRVTGAAVWHVQPERDVVGALDVLPNLQLLYLDDDDGTYLTFLMGYGFEGGGDTHLFILGSDVGYLPERHLGMSLGVRGVLGSVDGELGGGVRVVAGFDLWYGVFRIEAGYQVLDGRTGAEHDLRVGAGIDLIRLLVAPLLILVDEL